ncbi:MAG: bacteriohemerythrin [Gammaproteobacteria bacterium]|nr:bacteriohemerythrin [Gammaproteobacteria bacterium]MDH5619450.1 bacteriohemerythrin [Gammaproteobacteria bacterium]
MSLLKWKPEYSVGVASVDEEHREMIDMINRVYAQLGGSPKSAEIEACLEDIFATISAHFALEERIMKDAGYAEYEAHKNDHEDLLDEIRDLMDEFDADAETGRRALETRLSAWFTRHFSSYDARLHGELGHR